MKALVFHQYGPPSVLHLREVERPTLKNDEVLVRNEASVVSAAETAARSGSPFVARLYFGLRSPKWPILGNNFAGEVVEIGSTVTRFAVGDLVTGLTGTDFGAHAEFVRIAEDAIITHRPTGTTSADSVAILDGSVTALPFLREGAKLRAGQSVLINGASGAVGSAMVQLAHHYGAHVTAVCSGRNAELVRALGADEVIDYATNDFTTARNRYDVIIDAVGKSSYRRCRRALTRQGIYLTTVPTLAIMVQRLTTRLTAKKAGIVFAGLRKPEQMAADVAELTELGAKGALVPVIDVSYPLERGAEAHAYVDTERKRGSAVITIGDVA